MEINQSNRSLLNHVLENSFSENVIQPERRFVLVAGSGPGPANEPDQATQPDRSITGFRSPAI
jgi:hypothetical protein